MKVIINYHNKLMKHNKVSDYIVSYLYIKCIEIEHNDLLGFNEQK